MELNESIEFGTGNGLQFVKTRKNSVLCDNMEWNKVYC